MRLQKSFQLAVNILFHSKLRSWLTILGIVIGVAAVVAIISLGSGMQSELSSRLSGLGADVITISPGSSRAFGVFIGGSRDGSPGSTQSSSKNLTIKDMQVIKTVDNIKYIQGTVSGRGEVYYLSEKVTASIEGVDPMVWSKTTTSELSSGRLFGPSDYDVVIIGSRLAESTFKQPLVLNRIITIEGKSFKIVGILKESGAMGGGDNTIIMPIDAARNTLEDMSQTAFDSIIVNVENSDIVEQTTTAIDEKLMLSRHVTEKAKDYTVTSSKAMQETVSETMSSMTLFLTAIAAVSLIVGAVGIANTMFTTVLEKTHEIGIMKSIGAMNRDILAIFILNSILVGVVGGILGVILGSMVAPFISLGQGRMSMSGLVTPELWVLGMTIAILTGVISGVIPAYRASKLKPVDALRYE
ncbi:MAG: ABC transporter permease [Candidatus Aenigmatarchaeota archaeon]